MAATFTLSGDLATIVGANIDSEAVQVYVEASEPAITDTTAHVTRVGSVKATVNADGTWEAPGLLATNATDIVPAPVGGETFKYRVLIRYRDARTITVKNLVTGWFDLTANTKFDAIDERELTTISAEFAENIIGDVQDAATAAIAQVASSTTAATSAASAASSSATAAQTAATAAQAVGTTNDAIMRARALAAPAPDNFAGALAASTGAAIADQTSPAGVAVRAIAGSVQAAAVRRAAARINQTGLPQVKTTDLPTVAVTAGTAALTGSVFREAYNSAAVTFLGCVPVDVDTRTASQITAGLPTKMVRNNGVNAGKSSMFAVSADIDDADHAIVVRANGTGGWYWIIEDGRPLTETPVPIGALSAGADYSIRLTHASGYGQRRVTVYFSGFGFRGWDRHVDATIKAAARPPFSIGCGFDSLAGGALGVTDISTWPLLLALMLNFEVYLFASGGRGYSAVAADGTAKFSDTIVIDGIVAANLDLMFIPGSVNDDTQGAADPSVVQAAATYVYSQLATRSPKTQIIVAGPQQTGSSLVDKPGRIAARDAIRAAARAAPNVIAFLDIFGANALTVAWAANLHWIPGNTIKETGRLWVCVREHDSTATFDPQYWRQIGFLGGTGYSAPTVQTVTVTSTGSTFTLTYNGATTPALPGTATVNQVSDAVRALPGLGDATVSGSGPYVLTLPSQLNNVPALTATNATVVVTSAGGGNAGGNGNRDRLHGSDDVHPTFEGHRVLARWYAGLVVAALQSPTFLDTYTTPVARPTGQDPTVPPKPTNLRTNGTVTSGSVPLAFDAGVVDATNRTAATSHRIERRVSQVGANSYGSWLTATTVAMPTTTSAGTGLTPVNRDWQFRVIPINAVGEGTPSDILGPITTPAT